MLYYKQKPKDFTPLESGVVFTVGSTEECDITVEIVDYYTDSVVATKIFKGVESADIDIAPYVMDVARVTPSLDTVCQLDDVPVAAYYIVASSDVWREPSDRVNLSFNRREVVQNELYTIMPHQRTISYGECDDICFVSPLDSTVSVWINSDRGESKYLDVESSSGIVQLHIATEEFAEGVGELSVEIYVDNKLRQQLHYDVVPRSPESVRVVWVSTDGMVERYTFQTTLSKSVVAERERLFANPAVGEVVRNRSHRRITVRSHSLSSEMADRLSTIVATPKVWLELGGALVPAEVLETETVSYSFGKMASCQYTFIYGGEEVVL